MTGKNRYYKSSHVSEAKFRTVLKMFCEDIPALTVSALISVDKNTSQNIYSRLRSRVVKMASRESEKFTGEVEIDESYFGARRVRGKRGRGASGKTPVVGLLKRGGKVYTQIITNCKREQLIPIIKGKVLTNTTIYTDGWTSYDGLILHGYKHKRIHHHENEFARGKNHVNGIESFWGYTKTRMNKLRGIRKDKFLVHLKESEFRWNHRRENIYKLLLIELRKKPL
jgi:transposase